MSLILNSPGLTSLHFSLSAALKALDHAELIRVLSFPPGSAERTELLRAAVDRAAGPRHAGHQGPSVHDHLNDGRATTVSVDEATLIDVAAVRGVTPQAPLEPGCVFDGANGQDNERRVIRLALDRGWRDADAYRLLVEGQGNADPEEWSGALRDAELYLDHLAPAGFYFGTSPSLDYGVWAEGDGA